MQTTQDNGKDQEYEDGLEAGTELRGFQIGTIQTAIEGMDWSNSFIEGLWNGHTGVDALEEITVEEKERESEFYQELIKETEEYRAEQRMQELNAIDVGRESELVQE